MLDSCYRELNQCGPQPKRLCTWYVWAGGTLSGRQGDLELSSGVTTSTISKSERSNSRHRNGANVTIQIISGYHFPICIAGKAYRIDLNATQLGY